MDPAIADRLWGIDHAFDHPVTRWGITVAVVAVILASVVVHLLHGRQAIGEATYRELKDRIRSWVLLLFLIFVPILLGAFWVVAAIAVLGLLCYREYAKATGLFRHYSISLCVVLGILLLALAAADHWYGFFVALPALGVVGITAVSVLADRPDGYIQRTALGVFAFLLFGFCLAHVSYIANDPDYRPALILLFMAVELNDIFAYLSGKLIGKRKLIPHTSPNKTLGGALGALVATTVLTVLVGQSVFGGTAMDSTSRLIALGLILSLAGQLGDLVLSSIKRDLGVKDMGATLPGHGGVLDRFDSLLLAAPAFFHFVGYYNGFGVEAPKRILTLGLG